jgi:hypothetical protein
MLSYCYRWDRFLKTCGRCDLLHLLLLDASAGQPVQQQSSHSSSPPVLCGAQHMCCLCKNGWCAHACLCYATHHEGFPKATWARQHRGDGGRGRAAAVVKSMPTVAAVGSRAEDKCCEEPSGISNNSCDDSPGGRFMGRRESGWQHNAHPWEKKLLET